MSGDVAVVWDIGASTIITIGLSGISALAGVAGGWAVLRYRMNNSDKTIDGLTKSVKEGFDKLTVEIKGEVALLQHDIAEVRKELADTREKVSFQALQHSGVVVTFTQAINDLRVHVAEVYATKALVEAMEIRITKAFDSSVDRLVKVLRPEA